MISAIFATPSSEAISASVWLPFHTYDANTQCSLLVCHRNLVSTLRPLKENSFQNFVPTGNSHLPSSATLICEPSGSRTHRRFVAPSLHSGYCGENRRLRESIFNLAASEYSPVWDRNRGATGACGSACCPAVARPIARNMATATTVVKVFMT